LTAKPGFLLLQVCGHRAPLVPVSPTELLERIYFGHVVLLKDADGDVTGLTVRCGNHTFSAEAGRQVGSAGPAS